MSWLSSQLWHHDCIAFHSIIALHCYNRERQGPKSFSPFRICPVQTDLQKSVLIPALDFTLLLLLKSNHILVFTDPLTAPQCWFPSSFGFKSLTDLAMNSWKFLGLDSNNIAVHWLYITQKYILEEKLVGIHGIKISGGCYSCACTVLFNSFVLQSWRSSKKAEARK